MNKIDDEKYNELIVILSELIETIELMKKEEKKNADFQPVSQIWQTGQKV